MIVTYISSNKNVNENIAFIYEVLLLYTNEDVKLLRRNLDKLSMIFSDDFNISFCPEEVQPLIAFLEEKFNLKLNTDRKKSPIRSHAIIDTIFECYLGNLQLKIFISYFSYHKSIISSLKYELMEINVNKDLNI